MVDEVLDILEPERGGVFIDLTLGGGGHAHHVLRHGGEGVRLIGVDRDPAAIKAAALHLAEFTAQITLVNANHGQVREVLNDLGIDGVDGLLLDAGVSSHQLDTPERGFSFNHDAPLDMRMGPDAQKVTDLIDESSDKDLAKILGAYGEIRGAGRLARAILRARAQGVLETTAQLAELAGPRRGKRVHPATKLFQALRIAANRELESLEVVVDSLPDVLAPGGRAAFISFHSLEDRIVKHGVRSLEDGCTCPRDIPVCACNFVQKVKRYGGLRRPGEKEIANNPRSRSARLRGAVRLKEA
jgi:16S rRNA (cytosine1402-N4)-methyltransferase